MKLTKEWGLKMGAVLLAMFWLSLVAASWADAGEFGGDRKPAGDAPVVADETASRAPASQASASSGDSSDEYNFNWLDPEKKIYVLQNRRYQKANRLMLTAMLGTGFSNPYRETMNVDGRAAYYLSESWGFEAFYTYTANWQNATFNALVGTNTNVQPVVREITGQYGVLLHWVPWYAKINVFNTILHFDWYFSGGAGDMRSNVYSPATPTGSSQDNFAMYLGTGHIYHVTDSLLVRLDFTSGFYLAPIYGSTGDSSWYSNLSFNAGVGLKL